MVKLILIKKEEIFYKGELKMKHELLSPVGNMECLYQAIHNGCDAVYLGMKSFGARHFAANFSEEEIKEAVRLCHLYQVRIYVTMNTLIKNREVDNFLKQVALLHKIGVDAFIMQDIGMIYLVRKKYPNIEIHASTQANNSSIETIKMFHRLGVKRVVLSRELSLEEIKKIDVPIELEVFIHGALCISYSGCCLMSSMIGGRSGNRGECTGSCRLLYDLYDREKKILSDKYLLSTKELNTSNHIEELQNSNIKSFKIEGRMKSPEYVGFITKMYRMLLDKKAMDYDQKQEELKTLYHRKFTDGHLFNSTNIMNIDTSNHIGLKIGKVVEVTKNKIKIKLEKPLNQEDGIRFLESGKGFIVNYLYDQNLKLVNSSNDIVILDNKIDLKTLDTVYKTQDKKLNDRLKQYELKKIGIDISFEARTGKPMMLKMRLKDKEVTEYSEVVEKSINAPLREEQVIKQLEKLGTTCFEKSTMNIVMDDDIFIPVRSLNEIRRKAVAKLEELLKTSDVEFLEKSLCYERLDAFDKAKMTCTCYQEEQIEVCLKLGFDRIYVVEEELYQKYKENPAIYYVEKRNLFYSKTRKEKTLIHEYKEAKSSNVIGNYTLNVTNIYSLYYLLENGFHNVCLSLELSDEELEEFLEEFENKFHFSFSPEILVYGTCCNMMIKGNILNMEEEYFRYQIKDKRNRFFPVYQKEKNTYILNDKKIIKNIDSKFSYVKRFDFYEEGKEEIEEIIKKFI